MVSTVTTSTVSVVTIAQFSGTLAVIAIMVLLALLVQKEIAKDFDKIPKYTHGVPGSFDWKSYRNKWKKTSANFAGSAPKSQKKAFVFIDSSRYRGADSIFEKIEKPILEKKGIKTEMIDVNKPKLKCQ